MNGHAALPESFPSHTASAVDSDLLAVV